MQNEDKCVLHYHVLYQLVVYLCNVLPFKLSCIFCFNKTFHHKEIKIEL